MLAFYLRSIFNILFMTVVLTVCSYMYGYANTYSHTISMDGKNDFFSTTNNNSISKNNETFSTSSNGHSFYFTWDQQNIYFAFNSPDVAGNVTDAGQKWIWGYFGGKGGTNSGVAYKQQQPSLPFLAKYHFGFRVSDGFTQLQVWNGEAWKVQKSYEWVTNMFRENNAQYVEFKIPRADLDLADAGKVQFAFNLAVERDANQSMWASVPADSFKNGNGRDRDFSTFYELDLTAKNTAAAAQVYLYDFKNTSLAPTRAGFAFLTSPKATNIAIEQSSDEGRTWTKSVLQQAITASSNSAVVTNLKPNSEYHFRLVVNDGDKAGSSAIVSAKTPADNILPTSPTNLTVESIGNNAATIKWNAASDNDSVTAYELFVDNKKLTEVNGSVLSYTLKDLAPDTGYQIYIVAVDASTNKSPASNILTFRTIINRITIYYKNNNPSPRIRYRLDGGDWTAAPGILMNLSEFEGYYVISINLGLSSNVNVMFTDGDQTFPANGSASYTFSSGIHTLVPPTNLRSSFQKSGTPDLLNPIPPFLIKPSFITKSGFRLAWVNAQDNDQVQSYLIYLNDVLYEETTGTVIVFDSLNPDTIYRVKLKAVDRSGNVSVFSNEESLRTISDRAPSAPADVKATNVTENSIDVEWKANDNSENIDAYQVFLNQKMMGQVKELKFTISNLSPFTNYSVSVRAVNAQGLVSASSNEIFVKTRDVSLPSIPENLLISNVTANSFTVSWMASTDNIEIAGYEIFVNDQLAMTATSSQTVRLVSDLKENTNYVVKVRAFDSSNNFSAFSSEQVIRTLTVAPPNPPSDLRVMNKTRSTVQIEWRQPSGPANIARYEVQVITGSTWTSNTTRFTISNLREFTSYNLRVRAITNTGVYSAYSPILIVRTADATSPTKPSQIKSNVIVRNTVASIKLSWTASTDNDNVSSYEILINGNRVGASVTNEFIIDQIKDNRTYNVRIRARDVSNNWSTLSDERRVVVPDITPPPVPQSLKINVITATSAEIAWTSVSDESGIRHYEVYQNGKLFRTIAGHSLSFEKLTDGSTFFVAIRAVDRLLNKSPFSPSLKITTLDNTPPTTPTNLKESSRTSSGVVISWTPSTDNVSLDEYEVFLDGIFIGRTSRTSYALQNLSTSAYQVTVRAKDVNHFYSSMSQPMIVKTSDNKAPSSPVNLMIAEMTVNSVTLRWNPAGDNRSVAGYIIYQNGRQVARTTELQYRVSNIRTTSLLSFAIQAYDGSGNKSAISRAVQTPAMMRMSAGQLFINFQQVAINKQTPPRLERGVWMVPHSTFLQTLGFKTNWNAKTKMMTASRANVSFQFIANNRTFMVKKNGRTVKETLAVAPLIINNVLYIPVQPVAQHLDFGFLTR